MTLMKPNLAMAQRCLTGAMTLGCLVAAASQQPGSNSSLVTFDFLTGETSRRVVIELDEQRAPQTCANFRKQVESGYYQGMAVHRIIPNYLVQMGDPYTREQGKKHLWGTGGPEHTVPAELGGRHVRGSVAMARLPDAQNPQKASSGSQFYVALDDLKQLDGAYTVFGKVVRGIEHLDYVSQLTADTNDVPVSRVEIQRTGLGGELPTTTSLAERAAKPVEAAAEGLKGVGKAVTSNLPLIGGKEEKEAKEAKEPAKPVPAPVPAAVPPAIPAPLAPPTPAAAPVAAAPMPAGTAELSPEAEQPKHPILAKLAPSRWLVLGKKKEEEAESAAISEQATAVPVEEVAKEKEGEKKRLLPLLHKTKKSEETQVSESAPASPAPAKSEAKKEAPPPAAHEAEKPEGEPKEGDGKKGFFGRMLDKVRPGG